MAIIAHQSFLADNGGMLCNYSHHGGAGEREITHHHRSDGGLLSGWLKKAHTKLVAHLKRESTLTAATAACD
jgi:hypothetical protein